MLSLRETYGSSASPCPLSTTPVRKPLQHSPYHPLLSTLTGFPSSNKHIPLLEHKLLVNLAIILVITVGAFALYSRQMTLL